MRLLKQKTMLGELTKTQIENILTGQVIGRLACNDGKQPYIIPVTYAYDGTYIYGQTNEGTKLTIMRKNPNVCFEVDMITDMRNWQSVVVNGIFEEMDEAEVEKARDILFNRVFSLQTSSTIHSHEHGVTETIDDSNRVKYVMYRIEITSVTGRFERD
jgi:uncharacterized protein